MSREQPARAVEGGSTPAIRSLKSAPIHRPAGNARGNLFITPRECGRAICPGDPN